MIKFLHRYLAPFLTGVCMAGVTVVDNVPAMVILVLAAALLGFASLPAGGRMLNRLSGVGS
jgi:hypothetical protein